MLFGGFRWVVGDGQKILTTKDQWLAKKNNFRVDNLPRYEGRNETVSSLFIPCTKVWDSEKVFRQFCIDDAKAIMETYVPNQMIEDMIVWSKSADGEYNTKTGYRSWHDRYVGSVACTQSGGWIRI